MIYRSLVLSLLVTTSIIVADSYYEKGLSDGSELAKHMDLLVTDFPRCLNRSGGQIAELRAFLATEPANTNDHEVLYCAGLFKEFKAYYTGFYEAFAQEKCKNSYKFAAQPAFKEWMQTLYQTSCQICDIAKHAENFAIADREQCAVMKKNLSRYLTHTRPALELPVAERVIPVPTNQFYSRGCAAGSTLSTKLIQASASYEQTSEVQNERIYEQLARIRIEFLEAGIGDIAKDLSRDSSTKEYKQAFINMKQFFLGFQEKFRQESHSVESTCKARGMSERLINWCKLYHDFCISTAELMLGSTSMETVSQRAENLVAHYENLIAEHQLQDCSTFLQLSYFALSLEDDLIHDEIFLREE